MVTNVYAVLVNWNLLDDTVACLQSLFAAGLPNGQAIVVDNGSTDLSVETITRHFGKIVNVISRPENMGYAEGANHGMRLALQLGAEWVFLINNDAYVSAEFFTAFEAFLASHPETVMLGPVIYFHSEPQRIWFFGDQRIGPLLLTHGNFRNQIDRGQLPEMMEVDFLSGCALLIGRDVIEKVGFFDSSLFMYGEEVDYCWRAKQAGFKLFAVRSAQAWHKVSRSSNREKAFTQYLRTRNQIRFYRKYAPVWQKLLLIPFSLLRTVWMVFKNLVGGGGKASIKGLIHGLKDGWLGSGNQKVEPSEWKQ